MDGTELLVVVLSLKEKIRQCTKKNDYAQNLVIIFVVYYTNIYFTVTKKNAWSSQKYVITFKFKHT